MESKRYNPSFDTFLGLLEKGNHIPIYREIIADTETPVSAFLKIDDGGDAFLFESVEGGEQWGRYTFIGISPRATFKSNKNKVEISDEDGIKEIYGDPIEILRKFMSRYNTVEIDGLPRFYGGAVGCLGYDMVRSFERLPDVSNKDIDIPEAFFMFTDTLLVFDNLTNKIKIVANAFISKDTKPREVYTSSIAKINKLVSKLREGRIVTSRHRETAPKKIISNFSKEEFLKAVLRVKEYIKAGDAIQVVISQRFETPRDVNPLDIYRALRVINPSPYMFFLRLDGIELVGSSPEVLVRVIGSDVDVRPIAGTRPRGVDEESDKRFEKELLSDSKELAEHIMLVDLGRNDVGKVSEISGVEVNEFMVVEKYSHVMHIVSNVHGILKQDSDSLDALKACFPAGTLTGAPKVRAMEIIEELEPFRRGAYGGAVGYLGFSGNMDMCITIRTIVIKDDTVYIQAGAGIVADSDPEAEYQETINKAQGMLKALEMAREGLD